MIATGSAAPEKLTPRTPGSGRMPPAARTSQCPMVGTRHTVVTACSATSRAKSPIANSAIATRVCWPPMQLTSVPGRRPSRSAAG